MPIDYERMKIVHPKQKAQLTRAQKSAGPVADRYYKVFDACKKAVREWDTIGAWPDDWSKWQRALDDASFSARVQLVRLEDL